MASASGPVRSIQPIRPRSPDELIRLVSRKDFERDPRDPERPPGRRGREGALRARTWPDCRLKRRDCRAFEEPARRTRRSPAPERNRRWRRNRFARSVSGSVLPQKPGEIRDERHTDADLAVHPRSASSPFDEGDLSLLASLQPDLLPSIHSHANCRHRTLLPWYRRINQFESAYQSSIRKFRQQALTRSGG